MKYYQDDKDYLYMLEEEDIENGTVAPNPAWKEITEKDKREVEKNANEAEFRKIESIQAAALSAEAEKVAEMAAEIVNGGPVTP